MGGVGRHGVVVRRCVDQGHAAVRQGAGLGAAVARALDLARDAGAAPAGRDRVAGDVEAVGVEGDGEGEAGVLDEREDATGDDAAEVAVLLGARPGVGALEGGDDGDGAPRGVVAGRDHEGADAAAFARGRLRGVEVPADVALDLVRIRADDDDDVTELVARDPRVDDERHLRRRSARLRRREDGHRPDDAQGEQQPLPHPRRGYLSASARTRCTADPCARRAPALALSDGGRRDKCATAGMLEVRA